MEAPSGGSAKPGPLGPDSLLILSQKSNRGCLPAIALAQARWAGKASPTGDRIWGKGRISAVIKAQCPRMSAAKSICFLSLWKGSGRGMMLTSRNEH